MRKKAIIELVSRDTQLRSKRELVEKSIQQNLSYIKDSDDISEEFNSLRNKERVKAINALSTGENLDLVKQEPVIGNYLLNEEILLRVQVIATVKTGPD